MTLFFSTIFFKRVTILIGDTMQNSLFPSILFEKDYYRKKFLNLYQKENRTPVKNGLQKIIQSDYILEQVVLANRQKKVNAILKKICMQTNIDLKKNRKFFPNDIPRVFSILKQQYIDIDFETAKTFSSIDDVRSYLYDLAGIFCTPIDRILETLDLWKSGQIDISEYLFTLYEAGMTFEGNFEPVFERPTLFPFPQYIEFIESKDIVLIHMEFQIKK